MTSLFQIEQSMANGLKFQSNQPQLKELHILQTLTYPLKIVDNTLITKKNAIITICLSLRYGKLRAPMSLCKAAMVCHALLCNLKCS